MVCYSIPKYGAEKWELSPVKLSLDMLQSFLIPNKNTKIEGNLVGYRIVR